MVEGNTPPHLRNLLLHGFRDILAAFLRQAINDSSFIPARSNDFCDLFDDMCILLPHLITKVSSIEALCMEEWVSHADRLDAVLHNALVRSGGKRYGIFQRIIYKLSIIYP